jgi:hypothetical protein
MLECSCGYFLGGRWIQLAIEKMFFSRCGYHNSSMFITYLWQIAKCCTFKWLTIFQYLNFIGYYIFFIVALWQQMLQYGRFYWLLIVKSCWSIFSLSNPWYVFQKTKDNRLVPNMFFWKILFLSLNSANFAKEKVFDLTKINMKNLEKSHHWVYVRHGNVLMGSCGRV